MYATRALGPLIGGTTYQFLGIDGIYALIAASYLLCVWLAAGITTGVERASAGKRRRFAASRFLLPPRELHPDRRFQVIMGVTLVYNLWCFPFVGMVPVIAQKDFALSPTLVGALSACDGIGGTLGALIVGLLAVERTLFRFYYLGTLSFLLLVLALSLHLTIGAAIAVLLVLGVASASFSATQYALIYVISPPEMRGRATGVLSMFIGSSMFGPLAHRPAVRAAGLGHGHAGHGGRGPCRHAGAGHPVVAHADAAPRLSAQRPRARARGLRRIRGSAVARSDRAVDPVLQLLLLHQRADALGHLLAVLEDHQGRHRLDAYFCVTSGFWSTSSLATLTLPFISAATCSSAGAMALHGPHHSAKKSTTTGSDDCSTSFSKLASDTRSVAALGMAQSPWV